ncbi:MAG: tetratricopeptide repeat protein [Bacteroidetes bacterium]|nr:tetratricopeptide repeat protein [Bacteroidota bacterium]
MKKQTPPDPERAEFIARFWEARREHVNPPPDGARPAHEALVALADQRGWAWLKVMAEASRLGGARQYEKALSTLGPNDEGVPEAYRSYALFVRASVHQRMKANEAAMQFYRSVLADAGFDRPGSVWYNIGVMLLDSGDFNGAEDANLEALKDPNFVARGEAWNNLGFALAQRGDSAGAIEAYEKAIKDPSVWGKGKAWNNLGVELARQENYPAAIRAYRRALATEGYESPARAWHNLGLVLKETGDVQEARKAFASVLASPDIEGFHASARLSLMLLDTSLSSAVLSKVDQALLEKSPSPTPLDRTEQRLITKIQEAGDSQYDKYLRKKDSTRDGVLSILRGWSSAVTLLEGSERRWRGGGYFFKWRGHGVVLDPGFDFLRNFHDAGYHGREIQAVLVSHDHPDHNADLKGVDDLRCELFKRLANASTPMRWCGTRTRAMRPRS